MQRYRAPYKDPATREPLYRWPNEAAIEGEPRDVAAIVEAYHAWLLKCEVPKLFFYAMPGATIDNELAEKYWKELKNVKNVDFGTGRHCESNLLRFFPLFRGTWLEHLSYLSSADSSVYPGIQRDNLHLIGSELAKLDGADRDWWG